MTTDRLTIAIGGPRNSGKTWWAAQIKQMVAEKWPTRPIMVHLPDVVDVGNLHPEYAPDERAPPGFGDIGSASWASRERVSFSWNGTPYYAETEGEATAALKAKLANPPASVEAFHSSGVETALRARIKTLEDTLLAKDKQVTQFRVDADNARALAQERYADGQRYRERAREMEGKVRACANRADAWKTVANTLHDLLLHPADTEKSNG